MNYYRCAYVVGVTYEVMISASKYIFKSPLVYRTGDIVTVPGKLLSRSDNAAAIKFVTITEVIDERRVTYPMDQIKSIDDSYVILRRDNLPLDMPVIMTDDVYEDSL